tara:strand:- start:1873 stop:2118 length:246 start_codon:yes stop_codon:yes gene_type:complete
MEYNMADKNKPETEVAQPVEKTPEQEIVETANRAARSTIAVIDAVTQRGGFKGEELTTIGQLRDQCISLVQLYESLQQQSS